MLITLPGWPWCRPSMAGPGPPPVCRLNAPGTLLSV